MAGITQGGGDRIKSPESSSALWQMRPQIQISVLLGKRLYE
jgi:hypothetical protein